MCFANSRMVALSQSNDSRTFPITSARMKLRKSPAKFGFETGEIDRWLLAAMTSWDQVSCGSASAGSSVATATPARLRPCRAATAVKVASLPAQGKSCTLAFSSARAPDTVRPAGEADTARRCGAKSSSAIVAMTRPAMRAAFATLWLGRSERRTSSWTSTISWPASGSTRSSRKR